MAAQWNGSISNSEGLRNVNKTAPEAGAFLLHSAKPRYPRGSNWYVVKPLMNRVYPIPRREFGQLSGLPIRLKWSVDMGADVGLRKICSNFNTVN